MVRPEEKVIKLYIYFVKTKDSFTIIYQHSGGYGAARGEGKIYYDIIS